MSSDLSFRFYIYLYPTTETQMWVTSAVYTDKRPGDNMYLLATIYGYSVYIIVRHIVTYKGKITKKKNFITQ